MDSISKSTVQLKTNSGIRMTVGGGDRLSAVRKSKLSQTNSKFECSNFRKIKQNYHYFNNNSLSPPIKLSSSSSTIRLTSLPLIKNLAHIFIIIMIIFLVMNLQFTTVIHSLDHQLIKNNSINESSNSSLFRTIDQRGYNDVYCHFNETIEPKIVFKITRNDIREELLSLKSGCPEKITISFIGFGDKFVIELEKNKRLISDRYFKIISNDHNQYQSKSSLLKKEREKLLIKNNNNIELNSDQESHMFLNLHNFKSNDEHCHYQGLSLNGNINFNSAISIVNNKLLQGFFHPDPPASPSNIIYFLNPNYSNSTTILTKATTSDRCNSNPICSNNDTLIKLSTASNNKSLIRSRRGLAKSRRSSLQTNLSNSKPEINHIKHEPFQSNSSSLYVELLVVLDYSQYLAYDKNTSFIAERTMQIVNIMNTFYRQLNIFVALVGVVLWTEKDEIQLTNDGDSTLTNFLKYRHEKLLPKYHHDNAQLITSTSFNGSVVGKALKGPICTYEHSGGVNTDHSHNPAIIAVTLAHELGHNLGMEHDEEDKCKCPDEKCIMSSSSSSVHPKHWSSCSIEYLEESRKHGLLDCLIKKPEKVFGPICGNGFVEEGEDCDLGVLLPTFGTSKSKQQKSSTLNGINNEKCNLADGNSNCDPNQAILANPCCDKKTCKFTSPNATCAQGPCCDLSKCSVYNSSEARVCRRQKGECDFEEFCDGKSEYCPEDVYYHDGIECGPGIHLSALEKIQIESTRSRAYCYEGHCNSHLSQCNLLWGSSSTVSEDICYEQNVHGNTSGNCGYNRLTKNYETCDIEDSICGMLHCVHDQNELNSIKKTGKLRYGFESASILTVSFFVMGNHAKIYCHGAIIDSGPNVDDPGLVPDGASCGADRMCLNQKCVGTSDILYKNWCASDCNGNGICDNLGVCHCFDGTIGTSCYQFFGTNFHLSLLLYIIMFFVPLVALFILALNHYKSKIKIWWFLHNRKIELKNKYRASQQQQQQQNTIFNNSIGNNNNRRFGGDNDINGQHKPIISDPIPLNQHNVNRPFYEKTTSNQHHQLQDDPWAETSHIGMTSNNNKF